MLAAIEVYNKPTFAYREESFAILALNAWELLLKARVLQLANNRLAAILVYEKRQRADGTMSEKQYRRKSRSGAHVSISLFRALDLLRDEYGDTVHPSARSNLQLICEVRDNAIHFINKGENLSKLVQELGTACLRNYLALMRGWFGIDLSQYNFYLMPLAFVGTGPFVDAVSVNSDERRVIAYMRKLIADDPGREDDDYSIALHLDLHFSRSTASDATQVVITNDPAATQVTISEEDILNRYPWSYQILTTRLKKRYSNFKQNQLYHDLRKPLELDERYCKKRFLDPGTKAGIGKCFYNPNIVQEFDKHYTRIT